MRIFRAMIFAILLWVLIFFEILILKFGFKINETSLVYYYIHIPLLILFTLMCSLSYFWGREINRGFLQGLFLAIVFIVVLFLLDLIITATVFLNRDYSFLIRTDILIGELIIFVFTVIVGIFKK